MQAAITGLTIIHETGLIGYRDSNFKKLNNSFLFYSGALILYKIIFITIVTYIIYLAALVITFTCNNFDL